MVELLTTVAIVGMLAVLLVSSVKNIQTSAMSVNCLSNLRQISAGLHSFAAENGGRFPGYGQTWQERWMQKVSPYLNLAPEKAYQEALYHCPLVPKGRYKPGASNPGEGIYGLSIAIAPLDSSIGASIQTIANPSKKILLADKNYAAYRGIGAGGGGPILQSTAPFPQHIEGAAANHRKDGDPSHGPSGPTNYLFVDGHVETLEEWPGTYGFSLTR